MPNQGNQPWIKPELEAVPDFTRGDARLAAEVTLARQNGETVDPAAQTRAARVLCLLAGREA